jgi:TolB-like protein/DNA-binding winged helix-turn-helix (wHTH) protein/TPR repeat protein
MGDETDRPSGSRDIPGTASNPGKTVDTTASELYEFGPFCLDLKERKLMRGSEVVVLAPKAFDTLNLLVRNNGHLVERDELIRQLWPDSFVEDGNLSNSIFVLRKALGENPQYIETVPKRGYRFVGGVSRLSNAKTPPLIEASPVQSGHRMQSPPSDAAPRVRIRRVGITLAVISVTVLAIAAIAWRVTRRSDTPRQSGPQIRSLAVLPLANLSSDAEQDYFADGMTDALTTDLGKIGSLRVISRTSVMQYKGTKKPLPEVARDLNVDAIIEGTVSRSGNHVRITANLLQAIPERHIWAQSYDSDVGDALTVQGQIAQSVADEIQVTLTQKERNLLSRPRPANPDAQDLYFRGHYLLFDTEDKQEKAIRYLQQAIEKDPGYAAPYSALALKYTNWVPGANRPRDRMPKAREFALKALSLDNDITCAHIALGAVALFYDWDWTTAEKEFQRELELNPNHVLTLQWRARALVARGKTEEAVAEAKRSLGISPAVTEWDFPTWVFILARRYDLARERAQEMVDLEPNFPWGHFELAQVYEHEGRAEDGAREFLRADELMGTDPKELETLRLAMAKDGSKGYWKRKLQNYRESAKSGYVPPVLTAMACMRIGRSRQGVLPVALKRCSPSPSCMRRPRQSNNATTTAASGRNPPVALRTARWMRVRVGSAFPGRGWRAPLHNYRRDCGIPHAIQDSRKPPPGSLKLHPCETPLLLCGHVLCSELKPRTVRCG